MPKYLAFIEKSVMLCSPEVEIEAENKEEAEKILLQMLKDGKLYFEKNPYYTDFISTEIEEALY